jgi:hypothetical protein
VPYRIQLREAQVKKVRYAWGAVGVVPALAVMPAATAATATAQAPGTTAKTVSLQHSAVTSGCTASTGAKANNMSVKLQFWHKYNPTYDTSCIGTVSTSFFVRLASSESDYDRIRIYARSLGGAKYKAFSRHYPAITSHQHIFTEGIHRSFGYPPIQVCTAAVHGNGSVFEGPVCKSVG